MIANTNGNGTPSGGLYSGYNPTVDAVAARNAELDVEEIFDVTDEISVKQARVVEFLKLERKTRDSDDKNISAMLAAGAAVDKAVDGVLKAKQIGASIHNAGTVWTDYKAKQFVLRVISLLELELEEYPDLLATITEQLEGVRRTFATAEASTYTPDQDLMEMDATIPARG